MGHLSWPSAFKFSRAKWSGVIESFKHSKEEGAHESDNLGVI